MINFEEELAKFKPSKEVEEVEQILRNQTVTDIADLLAEVMEEKRKNQMDGGCDAQLDVKISLAIA